jgi:hypothetical protein
VGGVHHPGRGVHHEAAPQAVQVPQLQRLVGEVPAAQHHRTGVRELLPQCHTSLLAAGVPLMNASRRTTSAACCAARGSGDIPQCVTCSACRGAAASVMRERVAPLEALVVRRRHVVPHHHIWLVALQGGSAVALSSRESCPHRGCTGHSDTDDRQHPQHPERRTATTQALTFSKRARNIRSVPAQVLYSDP